jgi:asparagine synthetase B (glutamine-hydrolysing)
MIDKLLCDELARHSNDNECAVLLSGGVDSLSVAFAAQRLGKKLHAYTFRLSGSTSYDSDKALHAAEVMGWKCTTVEVRTDKLEEDFIRLSHDIKCIKKTHFECCFPFLHVYPHIEQTEVLSGWAADGYYGISKKAVLHYSKTKEKLDEFRDAYFSDGSRAGYNWHKRIADSHGKKFITPYLSVSVSGFFYSMDWGQLNKPYQKHHVVEAFKPEFDRIGKVKKHINLQLGSGIDELFETLLHNPRINFKNRIRVMDMCRDWAGSDSSEPTLDKFFT